MNIFECWIPFITLELYQEGKQSTHSVNDRHYSVSKILELVKGIEPTYLSMNDLKHNLVDYTDPDDLKRVEKSNISYPLLVYKSGQKYRVADGLHRLKKLHNKGAKTIKVILVPPSVMKQARLTQKEYDK